MLRAGRTIVLVVVALSFLNSFGTDGSFGNEDTETSVLSVIGKSITPAFYPMGLTDENWPATVGLFTGLFAKEAVVGTLNALYSGQLEGDPMTLMQSGEAAVISVYDNASALGGTLLDPLGLSLNDDASDSPQNATLENMAAYFGSDLAAFSYLVFILLYAPCVAVIAAMHKESGLKWAGLVFGWTTLVGYISATMVYQVGSFSAHPQFSSAWIVGMVAVLALAIIALKRVGRKAVPSQLIPAVQLS